MMRKLTCAWRGRLALPASIVIAALVAACGSSSTTSSAVNSAATGASSGANLASAKAIIAPYLHHPSAFPTNQPLKQRPPAGSKVVYVDVGTDTAALEWRLLQPAAKAIGVTPVRVTAGASASTVSAAFDSIVSMKPAGVLVIGLDPEEYAQQLNQLRAAGIPVAASAIEDGSKYNLSGPASYGPANVARVGRLVAAWALLRTDGKVKQFALYNIPELSFSPVLIDAAKAELQHLCPSCSERIVDIPVAQLGNGSTQSIVNDLEGHPQTGFAILASDELAAGLPSALKSAGLNIKTVGPGPGPENLQQIKQGTEDGALGIDLEEQMWAMLDQWARERIHQPLSGAEAQGELVMQFLTQQDITFNPANGWAGYPDLAQRFEKLWSK